MKVLFGIARRIRFTINWILQSSLLSSCNHYVICRVRYRVSVLYLMHSCLIIDASASTTPWPKSTRVSPLQEFSFLWRRLIVPDKCYDQYKLKKNKLTIGRSVVFNQIRGHARIRHRLSIPIPNVVLAYECQVTRTSPHPYLISRCICAILCVVRCTISCMYHEFLCRLRILFATCAVLAMLNVLNIYIYKYINICHFIKRILLNNLDLLISRE